VIGTLSALSRPGVAMRKSKRESHKSRTLIERIFFDIFKREMTKEERRVLLGKPKKASERN
jgi:hypothetical protein